MNKMKIQTFIQIILAIFIISLLIIIVSIKQPAPQDTPIPPTVDEIKLPIIYPNEGKG